MKIFIDTANTAYIKDAWDKGIICGVTTNPTLVAKEGRDFIEVLKEILSIVDGPVSAEVISLKADEMIAEGRKISAMHKNIVIKIPMIPEGMKAVKVLTAEGIKTNVTLIFSASQAVLAAHAGASYVSPFLGRLDDIGANGLALVSEISEIYTVQGIETEIIAASTRSPLHVSEAFRLGADVATVPYNILEMMFKHPLTDAGIAKFLADWNSV